MLLNSLPHDWYVILADPGERIRRARRRPTGSRVRRSPADDAR